jgi:predicted dehydrogenase
MSAPVRFATVGSNFIVDSFLQAGRAIPGFVHAAVYSRTAERAAEFAVAQPCERTFTSLEALARSDCCDAVYLASPTAEHARQAVLFLDAGAFAARPPTVRPWYP